MFVVHDPTDPDQNHQGNSADSGHYFTYSYANGRWFCLDDQKSHKAQMDSNVHDLEACTEDAYIVLFELQEVCFLQIIMLTF